MIAQTVFSSLHVNPLPSLSVSTDEDTRGFPAYSLLWNCRDPPPETSYHQTIGIGFSLGLFFSKGPHPGLRAQWGLPLWVFLGPFI